MRSASVLIAGAGPAGMAAAVCAAGRGRQVTVLDDNPAEGGQIWRGGKHHPGDAQASAWFRKLQASGAKVLSGCRIIGGDPVARTLRVEASLDAFDIRYDELILATGAGELFLPFPGWTLPNVMGAGGLQALVKGGLPVKGKRIVVAGSGPLLLAVAAYLRKRGATVPVIAEQTGWGLLLRFGMALAKHPGKLWQSVTLKASLAGTPYLPGSWVTAARGTERLASVEIRTGAKTRIIDCDYLAIAFGFSPNTELPELLGCRLQESCAVVDSFQRTSVPGIFCAGEVTGLGGVDLSLIEGQIAGYAATGSTALAEKLFPARQRCLEFATQLNRTFALRDELRGLPDVRTIICRCEDVSFGTLQHAASWRAAKLHFRCGMGPCQGRICGPSVNFLFGWKAASVRPPVFPARVASLVSESTHIVKEGIST